MLCKITIQDHLLQCGKLFNGTLSYEVFGPKLGEAPIVLVNHALTGNSTVSGEKGWWNKIIGEDKVISTKKYTVLAFNIPGNAYDGTRIENYKDFTIKDIAKLFLEGLRKLSVSKIYAAVGGSLGGGLAWQMAYLQPELFEKIVVIATDYKASDWVLAQTSLQEKILQNSIQPIQDARAHAMLTYRTPASLNQRFNNAYNTNISKYEVEDWLDYHGYALEQRFQLQAYFLMNHLLRTIDVANTPKELAKINSDIHIVGIDTDLFFTVDRNRNTYEELKKIKNNTYYHEISSIHGHDAFLIENEQLKDILRKII